MILWVRKPFGPVHARSVVSVGTIKTWKLGWRSRKIGRTDVPKIVDWYMTGKIQIDPMITHTMPLEEINKGFALMREGKSIRSVVIF